MDHMQKLSLAAKVGVARGVLASQYWNFGVGYWAWNWNSFEQIDPFAFLGSRKYIQNPNQISNEKNVSKITKIRWWNRKIGSVWVRLTEPPWFGGSAELTEPSEFGGSVNRTEQFGRSLA